ncbi:MAG: YdcF family protein [Eubacterium sp.]|nr:YdcF family protein [Candidatus Colimonas fimequi]
MNAIIIICIVFVAVLAVPNFIVTGATRGDIVVKLNDYDDMFSQEEIQEMKSMNPQCIIVLGASVKADGTPSPMLRQRLLGALQLYEAGVAPKILMTGDAGQEEYNEVKAMLAFVRYFGVPKEDVFCDYAGFSTYDSAYRAREVFQVDRAVVVTQEYHLYRALYGCQQMGIDAVGVATDQKHYVGQFGRDTREVLARFKDYVKWIKKPEPKYLGDPIPITGSGDDSRVLD